VEMAKAGSASKSAKAMLPLQSPAAIWLIWRLATPSAPLPARHSQTKQEQTYAALLNKPLLRLCSAQVWRL